MVNWCGMQRGKTEPAPDMTSMTNEQQQERIAQLEKALLQAQKQSALGELVSTTTHEFNNVLMTILNYAKMGIRHKDEPTRDKAFAKILVAGERAAKITNSVLGMARNRSQEMGAIQLKDLITETMVLLEREMQKYRIAVDYELHEVPAVYGIGNQIQQVLLNLLINARQAMPEGGRLIIRTVSVPQENMVDLVVRRLWRGHGHRATPKDLRALLQHKTGTRCLGQRRHRPRSACLSQDHPATWRQDPGGKHTRTWHGLHDSSARRSSIGADHACKREYHERPIG